MWVWHFLIRYVLSELAKTEQDYVQKLQFCLLVSHVIVT